MIAWVQKWWWAIAAGFVALAGLLLSIANKQRALAVTKAAVGAALAKSELQRLNTKEATSDAALASLQAQKSLAAGAHEKAVANLAKQLSDEKGMTDAEVDAELLRRGHR